MGRDRMRAAAATHHPERAKVTLDDAVSGAATTRSGAGSLQRDGPGDRRARARRGGDRQPTVDGTDAVSHVLQSCAAVDVGGIEAGAVVVDFKAQVAGVLA